MEQAQAYVLNLFLASASPMAPPVAVVPQENFSACIFSAATAEKVGYRAECRKAGQRPLDVAR
jgi:hypothetical protein